MNEDKENDEKWVVEPKRLRPLKTYTSSSLTVKQWNSETVNF